MGRLNEEFVDRSHDMFEGTYAQKQLYVGIRKKMTTVDAEEKGQADGILIF